MVIKFASSAPSQSPWAVHGDEIARSIMENSKGTVQVRQYHSGQLGSELAVLRKVVRGRVDITAVSLTAMAGMVPEIGLMGAPFF